MNWIDLFHSWIETTGPELPALIWRRWYLDLAWGLVMSAFILAAIPRRRSVLNKTLVAGLTLLSCQLPGIWAPSYWLGLAFQAPSISSALLAAWFVQRKLRAQDDEQWVKPAVLWLAGLGAILGWLLLLDTLALLPWSLFTMGFSALTPGLLMLLALCPWMLSRAMDRDLAWAAFLLAVMCIFIVLRLPNGNFWNALLDPWLWLGLNGIVLRHVVRRLIRRQKIIKT